MAPTDAALASALAASGVFREDLDAGVTAALSKKRGVGLELAFDFARLSLQQTLTRPSVSAVGIPARSRGAGVEPVSARRLVEPPGERRPGFQPKPSSLRDGTGLRRNEGPPITS